MTSGLILNEFDLDLSTASLLVRLWLIFFIVVIGTALIGSIVVDERVIADGAWERGRMAIGGGRVADKVSSLAFAHRWGCWGQIGLRGHRLHQASTIAMDKGR